VIGIYDTGPTTSLASPNYKGMVFVGYNGTFNPVNMMNLIQKNLKSSRAVNPGPHGGKMVCGYNTTNGLVASECVWANPDHLRRRRVLQPRAAGQDRRRPQARA